MIPLDDRGLTLGDGLFETLLAIDGRLRDWPAHLQRMIDGCAALGLPPPDAGDALALAEAALSQAGLTSGRAAVRLTLTAGSGGRGLERPEPIAPRLFATAAPAPPPAGPARLVTAATRRNEHSVASRLKTLAYLDSVLARREARAAGADEALMLNGAGEVACAAAANLFWIREGRLFTPALACGVLPGITRAQVLAAAGRLSVQTVEARAAPASVQGAQALFLTNSLIGVRPVAQWDGIAFGGSPLVEALAAELG